MGHWYGTIPTYKVSVSNQVFTLPPQFATIEKVAVCRHPTMLRNEFYQFSSQGTGVYDDPSAAHPWIPTHQVLLRNNAATSVDIVGPGKKVKLQCDVGADVGQTVLVLGYDDNGNWIRTQQGGVWLDGEVISLLQSPGAVSVNNFSSISGIQKPVTSGQIWLFDSANTLLSRYEYWETNPWYRRYLLPTVPNNTTQIDLIGKLDYRPVVNPTDWLIIGNLEALRLGCIATRREEEDKWDVAMACWALAVKTLNEELDHYKGSGTVPSIEVHGNSLTDNEPVPVLI